LVVGLNRRIRLANHSTVIKISDWVGTIQLLEDIVGDHFEAGRRSDSVRARALGEPNVVTGKPGPMLLQAIVGPFPIRMARSAGNRRGRSRRR
jgi:hypothetical protein